MGLFDIFSGGNSSSASSTTSIDKRQVVDGGSTGVSADHSTINLLDAGAIKQAFGFAAANDANASRSLEQVLGFAADSYDQAAKVLEASGKLTMQTGDLVSKAYDNAQGQGDQKTILLIMAGAVIALVAFGKVKAA